MHQGVIVAIVLLGMSACLCLGMIGLWALTGSGTTDTTKLQDKKQEQEQREQEKPSGGEQQQQPSGGGQQQPPQPGGVPCDQFYNQLDDPKAVYASTDGVFEGYPPRVTGTCFPFEPGEHARLGSPLHEDLRYLMVPRGWTVEVFENQELGGKSFKQTSVDLPGISKGVKYSTIGLQNASYSDGHYGRTKACEEEGGCWRYKARSLRVSKPT